MTDAKQIEMFVRALFKTRAAGGWQKQFRDSAMQNVESESRAALKGGKEGRG